MKLLLVDDDEISRMALSAMLSRTNLFSDVLEAGDGEEAWGLLQGGLRPALCCCDLQMPNLDGLSLLQRTREDARLAYLPFLMISASADKDAVAQLARAGISGFIVKPYSAAIVGRLVEKVLKDTRSQIAEPIGETRHRLGLSSAEVLRLTLRLKQDADQLLPELESSADSGAHVVALQKLRSACSTLGLHKCAHVLSLATGEPHIGQPAGTLVEEVIRMLEERVRTLQ